MQCLKEVTSFGAFQVCLNCFGCVLSVSPSALRLWLRLAVLLAAEVFPIFRLGVSPVDHGQALMVQWIIYSNQLKDGTTHPMLGTGSRKFPEKTCNMGHVQWGEELRSQHGGPPKIFWTHTSPSSTPSLRALINLMAGARFAGYCFVTGILLSEWVITLNNG